MLTLKQGEKNYDLSNYKMTPFLDIYVEYEIGSTFVAHSQTSYACWIGKKWINRWN